jgi:2-hydroxychromene-2-carboxylate isomerase
LVPGVPDNSSDIAPAQCLSVAAEKLTIAVSPQRRFHHASAGHTDKEKETMPQPIEFYFDFSSPYGYLASEKIDDLAARYNRKVNWRPILLGVVFKQTGGAPLTLAAAQGRVLAARFLAFGALPRCALHAPGDLSAQHDARCARLLLAARAGLRDGACLRPLRLSRLLPRRAATFQTSIVVLELAARHGADRATLSEALN